MGDKPDWCIRVQHVQVDRPPQQPFRAFSDTTNKLKTALEMPGMGKQIMYMYDDIYFTRKTYDLPQNFALQNMADINPNKWFAKSKAGERWIQLSIKTLLFLKKNNCTLYNCETHLPRSYDKSKLYSLIKRFDLVNDPMQIATLYYNWYGEVSGTINNSTKFGVYTPKKSVDIVAGALSANFLNHSAMHFNTKMKIALAELFPKKSPHEK